MVYFSSQVLGTQYYSSRWSRINCLSTFYLLLAIIVPALILYSIGNSWPQHVLINTKPQLRVIGSQVSCLDDSNKVFSSSSLLESVQGVSVGMEEAVMGTNGRVEVGVQVNMGRVASCVLNLFVNVTLEFKNTVVGVMAYDIYTPDTTKFIQSATIYSTLGVLSLQPRQQTYIPDPTLSDLNDHKRPTLDQPFYYNTRNLSVIAQNIASSVTANTTATTAPQITISIAVPNQNILYYATLKSQLREFIRQYIYLFVPVWFVLTSVLGWALKNRIYSARAVRNYKLQ